MAISATVLALAFALIYPAFAPHCLGQRCPTINEYGDWLSGFVQPIALAWLVAGFWLQREELTLQRQELALTRKEVSRNADAANESADIARLALVASNRAYVFHAGFRWISHFNPDNARRFWRIRPLWTNSGKTPTRDLAVRVWFALVDKDVVPEFSFEVSEGSTPATIAPGGAIESAFCDLDAEDIQLVKLGQKALYSWGIAAYRDVFPNTDARETKFTKKVIAVTGNPFKEWNAESNPLEIMFGTFGEANTFDGER